MIGNSESLLHWAVQHASKVHHKLLDHIQKYFRIHDY